MSSERSELFGRAMVFAIVEAAGGEVILEPESLSYDGNKKVYIETLEDGKIRVWTSNGVGKY